MLVQLGSRSTENDVVDLLLECHARIRNFLAMARRLATTADVPASERREVASQVHRYFTSAFPLHLADEDELLVSSLAGRGADAALATMRADHVDHAPVIARLVGACEAIMRDPRPRADADAELLAAAELAVVELEPHLTLEEREILPLLRELPQAVSDEIRAAMRARRVAVLRPQ